MRDGDQYGSMPMEGRSMAIDPQEATRVVVIGCVPMED